MYPLKVMNSLTRTKVRFIPMDPSKVTWYQCGPTVYAESHMGHARTYVSLDAIRRIAKEYLGYNVILCQNVTDIDDKIIKRSSERQIPFRELAAKYEQEFNEDMTMLGVQLPDIVTRVSEYVPEIVAYIQVLIDKGIAYESNGSVYFSVAKFQSKGHTYGKLMPDQVGNAELLAEGEGALTSGEDKVAAQDFALWKKTKDHTEDGIVEPSWPSPWGQGRPGWHIECSVMSASAFDKYGKTTLDIHCGGVDLKFPHHENEVAQSEAYFGCKQWVNYWLHTGHLNIKGLKMSKSLKNFITIREALEQYTARQLRFCFLLHKYNDTMDFGDNTMGEAVAIEKIFSEFFHKCKAVLRRLGSDKAQYVGEREGTMLNALESAKTKVRAALLDDFDIPGAIDSLRELVKETNKYLEENVVSSVVLSSAARYITSVLRVLGLVNDQADIGFPLDSGAGAGVEGAGGSREATLTPFLDILTKFREAVRLAAIAKDTTSVLQAADQLRDLILPDVGVRMEDKGTGANVVTIWKLDDPEVLRKERAQKEEAKAAKEQQKLDAAKKLKEKEEKAKIDPKTMYLSQTDLYSAFDANGIPTHDKAGEPVSKSVQKKLQKEWEKQKESYDKYLAKGSDSSTAAVVGDASEGATEN
jgi:cysteinyl-tRNA synthetase